VSLFRALAVTITVVIIAAVALVVLYELMSTENLTLTFAALAVMVTVIYGETDSAYPITILTKAARLVRP
jgi:hypothetical protein